MLKTNEKKLVPIMYVTLSIIMVSFFYFNTDVSNTIYNENNVNLIPWYSVVLIFIVNSGFAIFALSLSPFFGLGFLLPISFFQTYGIAIASFSGETENTILYVVISLIHGIFEFFLCYIVFKKSMFFLINIKNYKRKIRNFNYDFKYFYREEFLKSVKWILIIAFLGALIEVFVSNRMLNYLM